MAHFDDDIRHPKASTDSDDIFIRSRSAPPQVGTPWALDAQEEKSLDPTMLQHYQSQRRLNPRLPKRLYSNFVDTKKTSPWNPAPGGPSILKNLTDGTSSGGGGGLIGSIQRDFPRTESPIYKHERSNVENAFAAMRVSGQAQNTHHTPVPGYYGGTENTYATQLAAAQAAAASAQYYSQLAMNMSLMHQQQQKQQQRHETPYHRSNNASTNNNNNRRGGGGRGGRGGRGGKRYNKEKENSRKIVTNLNLPPLGKGK